MGITCLILLTLIVGRSAAAQTTDQVSSSPVCPDCRIEWSHIVSLGGPNDADGLISNRSTLAIDSRNRFYVSPTYNPGEVLIFDSTGSMVHRLGRTGRGPGEYLAIQQILVTPGDSLLVVDPRNIRLTVISPAGDIVRMARIPPGRPYRVIPQADGSIIVQSRIRTAASIGLPIHHVGVEGEVLSSFGSRRGYRADQSIYGFRAIATGSIETIWSAFFNQYLIELWDYTNTLLRTLEMEAPWFEPWEAVGPDNPAPPTVRDLRRDESGFLWVLIQVPSERDADEERLGPLARGEHHDKWDIRVDIVDTQNARLLATGTHPLLMERWVGDRLYSTREGPQGERVMDVWRVQLTRPN
jgi:hypothetical protein